MDAGIADTLNRGFARQLADRLDAVDATRSFDPWHHTNIARTLMGENAARDADRAWLVGQLMGGTSFDGPADEDWENFFAYIRAEILARRDPPAPSVRDQPPARDGVGSR